MLCWSSATWTPCGRDRPLHVLLYLLLTRQKSQKPLTNCCGFLRGRINDACGGINLGGGPQSCHQVTRDRAGRWCRKAIQLMYYKQHNEYRESIITYKELICKCINANHLVWHIKHWFSTRVIAIVQSGNGIHTNLFRIQNTSQVSQTSIGSVMASVITSQHVFQSLIIK